MKRTMAIVLVALMAFTVLSACNKEQTVTKDTLTLGLRMDVGSFAPTERTTDGDTNVQGAIYMNLFQVLYPEKIVASMACESWEVSPDAKSFTFKLKSGITFHNGATLSISDVVYSINLCRETPASMTWSLNLDTVEALDENTVRITLLEPRADFLYVAAIPLLHEKTTVEAGESFRENPVGCGPYQLVKHEAGYQVTLKAFDKYIMGKPYFENLVYRIIPDPSAALMAVEAGEIDAVNSSLWIELENLKANKDLAVLTSAYGIETIVMNHNIEPFNDVNVRLAVNYAIDKERCSDAQYEGGGIFPSSHIPTVEDSRLKGYPTDVAKAKEYLAAAGYPEGQGFPTVIIETIDSLKTYAQIVQSNLKDIGINAEVQIGEPNAFVTRVIMGEVPFAILGFGLGDMPSAYNDMLKSDGGFNLAFYNNPEVDRLLNEATSELDDAKRHDLYVQACLILEQDSVYGLIGYQQPMTILRSNLELEHTSATFIRPEYVKLK